MELYFVTGSAGKFKEVQALIPTVQQLKMDLPEIQELDAHVIIKAKLEEAAKHHSGALMVEDTSLYFEGMNGLPGTLNKWFVEAIGFDGLYTLAAAFKNFGAEAKTIIGYRGEEGAIEFFEGSTKGTVVPPREPQGFGWDCIFVPEGHTKTYGEMGEEEKNSISHRGKAVRKLKEHLEKKPA